MFKCHTQAGTERILVINRERLWSEKPLKAIALRAERERGGEGQGEEEEEGKKHIIIRLLGCTELSNQFLLHVQWNLSLLIPL